MEKLPERKTVILIAWPIIVSNLSTPILGLVDIAVIGNLGDPALIGAVAVGAIIFTFIYWGLGFLRMGTTGLIAQYRGTGDDDSSKAVFYRSLFLAITLGLVLLLTQTIIASLAFSILGGSATVEETAATYFDIRIWSAPFSLMHLVLIGYLLAHQQSKAILLVQLLLNGTNIILDFLFVVGFGWEVSGVAAATVLAEIFAASIGSYLVIRHAQKVYGTLTVTQPALININAIFLTLSINRDLMIRTLSLIFAFAWFTNQGAKSGDVILATNAILMQFISFSAFFLDGYALAAESLIGTAVGKRNLENFKLVIRYITELGLATAAVLSIAFFLAAPFVVDILTNASEVRLEARKYLYWVVAAPLTSVWCYLLDGVFVGATCTKEMRNAMLFSLLSYLGAWYFFAPLFFNHGLWLSLHLYFIIRASTLWYYLPSAKARCL